jgi:hypothetical protein
MMMIGSTSYISMHRRQTRSAVAGESSMGRYYHFAKSIEYDLPIQIQPYPASYCGSNAPTNPLQREER